MALVGQVFYGIFVFRIHSRAERLSHVAIISQVFYNITGGLILVSSFLKVFRCSSLSPMRADGSPESVCILLTYLGLCLQFVINSFSRFRSSVEFNGFVRQSA